jgi:hypothetical protein
MAGTAALFLAGVAHQLDLGAACDEFGQLRVRHRSGPDDQGGLPTRRGLRRLRSSKSVAIELWIGLGLSGWLVR